MNEEIELSYQKLTDAFNRLREGVEIADDELSKDGVIQRFEFTFELLWKTLRLFLADQGIITNSPKEALKAAFRFGLFTDQDTFLKMLEDRNISSHNYNQEKSEQIFERIKKIYLQSILNILNQLSLSMKK